MPKAKVKKFAVGLAMLLVLVLDNSSTSLVFHSSTTNSNRLATQSNTSDYTRNSHLTRFNSSLVSRALGLKINILTHYVKFIGFEYC